jgi:hypothetical protein
MGDFNETIGEFATDANIIKVQPTRPCHAANHGIDGELETYLEETFWTTRSAANCPTTQSYALMQYRTL